MKVWFDTEFIEDWKTIDLISIGIVCEDGISYYAENAECKLERASPWVRENVFPWLQGGGVPRKVIANEIIRIVGDKPEFWAYYADYDWVALCQLYGTMMDLPKGWPMYCRDLKQLADSIGNPNLLKNMNAHHALDDALWVRRSWEFLSNVEKMSKGETHVVVR